MRIAYLDFDGVVNGHEWCHLGDTTPRVNRNPAICLQKILDENDLHVVIVSTWKRHIRKGELNLKGMEFLFKTHGIKLRLNGILETDDQLRTVESRSQAIASHFENSGLSASDVVVIDDMNLVLPSGLHLRHIKPHPGIGLEPRHVSEVRELFK